MADDSDDSGNVVMPTKQFRGLIRDAAREGAQQALAELGLENGRARQDIDDLRGLASAVRTMRSTALKVATQAVTLAIIAALFTWIGARTRFLQTFKPFTGG